VLKYFFAILAPKDKSSPFFAFYGWPLLLAPFSCRINFGKIFGRNQITDVYLLALAVAHRGALVTLDRHTALTAVTGATDKHLAVLR
jgi:hypothetical protein